MKIAGLKDCELDEFGRARLSDADLALIDELGLVTSAGGDGVNYDCGSKTNGICRNEGQCDGSTNGGANCTNAGSCNNSQNTKSCQNTAEMVELAP